MKINLEFTNELAALLKKLETAREQKKRAERNKTQKELDAIWTTDHWHFTDRIAFEILTARKKNQTPSLEDVAKNIRRQPDPGMTDSNGKTNTVAVFVSVGQQVLDALSSTNPSAAFERVRRAVG